MGQQMIPCWLMRGGTSRGTYFLKGHLPHDKEMLDQVLLKVMGSPDPLQIDGLGGATTTTSKVAVLSTSQEPGIDIDFLFAQVSVTTAVVDWGPTCGNILAGVGPAAIEMGLIENIGQTETKVRIRLVNTGGFVEAVVRTPGGHVTYEGDTAIDGVPGTSAPIELNFVDIVGSKTGKLLPTGRLRDLINGVEVSCIDCAMPTVIARASALGKTGFESKLDLDLDVDFFRRMEGIRRRAGELMGLGDVAGRVVPKFAIVAEPRGHGNLMARYFVPTTTHASMAVTGGIAISCCSILEGTVAYEMAVQTPEEEHKQQVIIEHPAGEIAIILKAQKQAGTSEEGGSKMQVHSAGAIRTARLLFTGMVQVPRQVGRQPWTTAQRARIEQGAQGNGAGKRQGRGKARASAARAASKAGSGNCAAAPAAAAWRVQAMALVPVRWAAAVQVGGVCGALSAFL